MAFSWKRGALHAGLGLLVIVVVTFAIGMATGMKDPEKFGEGVGRFACFGALGVLGLSYLVQTGRKKLAAITAGATLAGIAALVIVLMHAPASPPLSAVEKADLTAIDRDDKPLLEQPALGFSIAAPGKTFAPLPRAMYSALHLDAQSQAWGYSDSDASQMIIIIFAADVGASEDDFRTFLDGVHSGIIAKLAQTVAAGGKAETVSDTIDWPGRQAHQHWRIPPTEINVRCDALAGRFGGRQGTVMAITFDLHGDHAAALGASLARE